MRFLRKLVFSGFLLLLSFAFFSIPALTQVGSTRNEPSNDPSALFLSGSQKRVVFDGTPFSAGSVVPYWDKGYLISIKPETNAPGVPNVTLYNAAGQKVRDAAIWFPDAQTVFLLSADVTSQGNIVGSGTAVKADGTRAYFIADTDGSGKMAEVIQTNPFFPAHVCSAPDGMVWSFGDTGTSRLPTDDTLRKFALGKGLLASYLPLSTFGAGLRSPAQRGNPGYEVYVRCSGNRVAIYSGVSSSYVDFDTDDGSFALFKIDRSSTNLPVKGIAVTDSADVYGFLRDNANPGTTRGLFYLAKDSVRGVVKWVPVRGASGRQGEHGVVNGLWGVDGNALVHGYDDDPAGRVALSWSVISRDVRQ